MRNLIIFIMLFALVPVSAQQKRIFLFEKFVPAKVKMKPRGVVNYVMNYDAANGKMYFLQGEDMMELTNPYSVDTISWGERHFTPFMGKFLEVMERKNGNIYVEWVIRDIVQGKKGAFGTTTQGSVQTVRMIELSERGGVNRYTPHEEQAVYSTDVLKRKNLNVYHFDLNGKREKIKSIKQIIKLFPGKESQINDFIKENKTDYNDPLTVIDLIDYCRGL